MFDDLSGNGVFGGSDTGLAGWTVYLDLHQDQRLEPDDPTAVTDANGNYTFTNVAPGTYELGIVPESGWLPTLPTPGTAHVTVAPGQTAGNENFGVIAEIAPEEPPVVGPTVNLTATAGVPLSYQVVASSPEGYPLTYSVDYGPYPDITIDPETGVLTWTPSQVGPVAAFWVRVADDQGGSATEQINITVNGQATPPVITSTPPAPAIASNPYQYQIEAQGAAAADVLRYTLVSGPTGMNVNVASGLLTWTPPAGHTSVSQVVVEVTDVSEDAATATQSFMLPAVIPVAEVPPSITSVAPTTAIVDVPYLYQVVASSANGTALTYSLTSAPSGMSISSTGLIDWVPTSVPPAPGTVSLDLVVTDAMGGTATQPITIHVVESATPVNPTFTSTPTGPALAGYPYQYQVTVSDTSGTADVYALTEAPQGMSINPATGLITWTAAVSEVGSFTVTVEVQNGTGGKATQTYPLTVDPAAADSPPVITSTPGGPAEVGYAWQYQVVAYDPDGDPLSYRLDQGPAGMSITASGLLSYVPTSGQVGSQPVTIAVSDGRGGEADQSFNLAVVLTGDNDLPVISSNPSTASIPVGDAYQYQVVASEADDSALTYSLITSASGMSIDPNSGLFTWTPTSSQLGQDPVTIAVTNSRGATATQPFTLTVVASGSGLPGDSITIASTPIDTAAVGHPYEYQLVAQDADDAALGYAIAGGTVGSGGTGGSPTSPPAGMTISSTGLLTWTPSATGNNPLVITVSDSRGVSLTQPFNLLVVPDATNRPPQFTSTPATTAYVNQAYSYQAVAVDPDGAPVTYSLSAAGEASLQSGLSINATTGLVTWTPTGVQAGPQPINVVATDDRGASITQSYTLNVTIPAVNSGPVISSQPPLSVLLGTEYIYLVSASEANGAALNYALPTAPAGMSITSTGQITWTPTANQVGSNSVTLTVSDAQGNTVTQSFTVNVNTITSPVSPPVITSTPPTFAILGQTYGYNATGSDPNGYALAWSLGGPAATLLTAGYPANMSISSTLGTIRWTPSDSQLGPQTVTLVLTDAAGVSTTQTFTINVLAAAAPPQITSTPPTSGVVGQLYQYQIGATTSTGQPLTYSLVGQAASLPSGMSINPTTGLVTWTPTDIGTYPITVQVTDVLGQGMQQSFPIDVTLAPATQPPVITTQPVTSCVDGVPYVQPITAQDPQGEAITFSLQNAADNMNIDPNTGLITWMPAGVGSGTVTVQATDTSGLTATLNYTLTVHTNLPPTITSSPPMSITAGLVYSYDLTVDGNGDTVSYSLAPTAGVAAPAGMTIDSLGRITWDTDIADIGAHPITIDVTSAGGLVTPQPYTLDVVPDTQAPTVIIQTDPIQQVNMGQSLTVLVSATDNVGVTGLTLTANGTNVTLLPGTFGTSGVATLTFNTAGPVTLEASASDAADNEGTANTTIFVVNPSVTEAPVATIASPSDGTNLTAPVPVIGTVSDPENALVSWSLTITPDETGELPGSDPALTSEAPPTTIASGTTPITNGTLGTLDTTLLSNGAYDLTLTATNAGGLTTSSSVSLTISGNLKLGALNLSFTDMTVQADGIPITITRNYSSLTANTQGDFGYGWTLGLSDTKVQVIHQDNDLSDFGDYVPMEDGDRVIITLPDGTRDGFTFEAIPGETMFGLPIDYQPDFVPDAGTKDKILADEVSLQPVGNEWVNLETGDSYNPALPEFGGGYLLQLHNGTVLTIDGNTGDLVSIADRNNNTLTFTNDGIQSSAGPGVTFTRDQTGRITSITSYTGQTVSYQYDSSGNLIAFTGANGNTTQFTYLTDPAHYLNTIIDANEVQQVTFQYTDGRVSSITDADGSTENLAYDPNAKSQTTYDALNYSTTTYYDDNGNPIEVVSPLGGVTLNTYDSNDDLLSATEITPEGNLTTTYTYDQVGDQLSVTNPDGTTTYKTYNEFGEPLTQTDALGNVTSYNYDQNGNVLSVTDPGGGPTHLQYNNNGELTSVVDSQGNVTTLGYNPAGQLLSETAPTGLASTYTYDSNGNETSSSYDWINPANPSDVQPVKNSATYDADGNMTSSTDSEGQTTTNTYTPDGHVATTTAPNGDVTDNIYAAAGNLIETREQSQNASGNSEWLDTLYVYDANGNIIAQSDPFVEGSTAPITGTLTSYDALGDETDTQSVTGMVITLTGSGSQISSVLTSPGTVVTTSTAQYDDLGRETSSTDQYGHQTLTTYDTVGRVVDSRTQSVDQNGQTVWLVTQTVYNAQGQVELTTDQFQEGSSQPIDATETIYDSLGRAVQSIRLQGVVVSLINPNTVQPVDPTTDPGNIPVVSEVTNWGSELYSTKTVYNAARSGDRECCRRRRSNPVRVQFPGPADRDDRPASGSGQCRLEYPCRGSGGHARRSPYGDDLRRVWQHDFPSHQHLPVCPA